MKISISFNQHSFIADFLQPIDISLPLRLNEDNPCCYWAEPPRAETIRAENFIGSVKQGGSVNYQKITITPHGNGTHTECYGHISADDQTLNQSLTHFHFIAELVTVTPESQANGDRIITQAALAARVRNHGITALIVRTLPNDTSKQTRQYSGTNPPYVEPAAMRWLVEYGIDHLLVDLPSIDKEVDGGRLAAHKQFWTYPEKARMQATITELIYVDSDVVDGLYLLNLQITSLEADASPAKPVLYKLTEVL
jgi:arylformamidase